MYQGLTVVILNVVGLIFPERVKKYTARMAILEEEWNEIFNILLENLCKAW